MNSYDITTALAVERTNTLLAEAANARLVKAAQRAAREPAATRNRVRWNPIRWWRVTVA